MQPVPSHRRVRIGAGGSAIATARGTAAGEAWLSAGKLAVVASVFVGRSVGGIVAVVRLLHALQRGSIGDATKPWFVQLQTIGQPKPASDGVFGLM